MKTAKFFYPFGAQSFSARYPRLAPWAVFLRRILAGVASRLPCIRAAVGPAMVGVGLMLTVSFANASILGSVRGLIHDPQHRPVSGATVKIHAVDSAFEQTVSTNDAGEFVFEKIPIGEYTVNVESSGFRQEEQRLTLGSGHDVRLHFSLQVATTSATVEVHGEPITVNPSSSTTATLVSREQIAQIPGADQSNSLAMITSTVPSAYIVHDQLHIRGGHQVSWLLDGVPVPNTNIASNVGPQFDPKDIDYLEVQRGGFDAENGDRTYGVFNVVTRSGFERDRQAELSTSYGSYNNTDNQISFGDHSERLAYFGSFSGYRTGLGLETPIARVLHDQAAGLGGFGSVIFNKSANDQLRLVTSVRGDHYQVPVDPAGDTAFNHDVEDERDAFANFSWVHSAGNGVTTTVSPFYHFNRAHYIGDYFGEPDPDVDDSQHRSRLELRGRSCVGWRRPREAQRSCRLAGLGRARQPVLRPRHQRR